MKSLICFKAASVSLLPKRGVFEGVSGLNLDQKKEEAKAITERVEKFKGTALDNKEYEGKVKYLLQELKAIQDKVSTLGAPVKTKLAEHLKVVTGLNIDNPEDAQTKVNEYLKGLDVEKEAKNAETIREFDKGLDVILLRVKFRKLMAKLLDEKFKDAAGMSTREQLGTYFETQLSQSGKIKLDGGDVELAKEEDILSLNETQFKLRIEQLWEMMKYAKMRSRCVEMKAVGHGKDGIGKAIPMVDAGIAYPKQVGSDTQVQFYNYWLDGDNIYAIDNVLGHIQMYNPRGVGAGNDAWVFVDDKDGADKAFYNKEYAEFKPAEIEAWKKKVQKSVSNQNELAKLVNRQRFERGFISAQSRNLTDLSDDQKALEKAFHDEFEALKKQYIDGYTEAGKIGKIGSFGSGSLAFFDTLNFDAATFPNMPSWKFTPDAATTVPAGAPKATEKGKDKKDEKKPEKDAPITDIEQILVGMKSNVLPWAKKDGKITFPNSKVQDIAQVKKQKPDSKLEVTGVSINGRKEFPKIFKINEKAGPTIDYLQVNALTDVNRDVSFKKGDKIEISIAEKDSSPPNAIRKPLKVLTLVIGEAVEIKDFFPKVKLDDSITYDETSKTYHIKKGKIDTTTDAQLLVRFDALPPGIIGVKVKSIEKYGVVAGSVAAANINGDKDGVWAAKNFAVEPPGQYAVKLEAEPEGGSVVELTEPLKLQIDYPEKPKDLMLQFAPDVMKRGTLVPGKKYYLGKLNTRPEFIQNVKVKPSVGKELTITPDTNGNIFYSPSEAVTEGFGNISITVSATPIGSTEAYTESKQIQIQRQAESFNEPRVEIDLEEQKLVIDNPIVLNSTVHTKKLFRFFHLGNDFKNQKVEASFDGKSIKAYLDESNSVYMQHNNATSGVLNTIDPNTIADITKRKIHVVLKGQKYSNNDSVEKEFNIPIELKSYSASPDWIAFDEGYSSDILLGEVNVLAAGSKQNVTKILAKKDCLGLETRSIARAVSSKAEIDQQFFEVDDEGNIAVKPGKMIPSTPEGFEVKLFFKLKGKNGKDEEYKEPLILKFKEKPEVKADYGFFITNQNTDVLGQEQITGPAFLAEFVEVPKYYTRNFKNVTLVNPDALQAAKSTVLYSDAAGFSAPSQYTLAFVGNILKLEKGTIRKGQYLRIESEITGKVTTTVPSTLFIYPTMDDLTKTKEETADISGVSLAQFENESGGSLEGKVKELSCEKRGENKWEVISNGYSTMVVRESNVYKIKQAGITDLTFENAAASYAFYAALALNYLMAEHSDKDRTYKYDDHKITEANAKVYNSTKLEKFPDNMVNTANFVANLNSRASAKDSSLGIDVKLESSDSIQKLTNLSAVPLSIRNYDSSFTYYYSFDGKTNWQNLAATIATPTIPFDKIPSDKREKDSKFQVYVLRGSKGDNPGAIAKIEYELENPFTEYKLEDSDKKLVLNHKDTSKNISYTFELTTRASIASWKFESDGNDEVKIKYQDGTVWKEFAVLSVNLFTGNLAVKEIKDDFKSKFNLETLPSTDLTQKDRKVKIMTR